MIELIIKITDSLFKLIQLKESADRELFENHVAVIFDNCREVIDDYRNIVDLVESQLKSPRIPIYSALTILEDRRKNYQRMRGELIQYARMIEENKFNNSMVHEFASATLSFLLYGNPANIINELPTTKMISLLEALTDITEKMGDTKAARRACLAITRNYQRNLDRGWRDLTDQYYKLKISL